MIDKSQVGLDVVDFIKKKMDNTVQNRETKQSESGSTESDEAVITSPDYNQQEPIIDYSQIVKDSQIINLMVDELVQFPFQIRFRQFLKDSIYRVVSVLIRHQYMMGIKRGITFGEINKNITKKYRKHAEMIVIYLAQHGWIMDMVYHGRHYYGMNHSQVKKLTCLKQDLEK